MIARSVTSAAGVSTVCGGPTDVTDVTAITAMTVGTYLPIQSPGYEPQPSLPTYPERQTVDNRPPIWQDLGLAPGRVG